MTAILGVVSGCPPSPVTLCLLLHYSADASHPFKKNKKLYIFPVCNNICFLCSRLSTCFRLLKMKWAASRNSYSYFEKHIQIGHHNQSIAWRSSYYRDARANARNADKKYNDSACFLCLNRSYTFQVPKENLRIHITRLETYVSSRNHPAQSLIHFTLLD